MIKVAIVKYNAGNIYSVYCAVKRLGAEAVITDDPEVLRSADRVIFPGVGEARAAMDYLRATGLDKVLLSLTQPVLGICIGMQLLCQHSEEGDVDCLGVFDVPVVRFNPSDASLKVPQMGWNTVTAGSEDKPLADTGDKLFSGIEPESYFYYVHSYHVPLCQYTIATTDYSGLYSAALHKDNFWAVQFHPEKSGPKGELLLKNFLDLTI